MSAFYKSDVQINYLAELVRDNSAAVKECLVHMLGELMTEMGDRYDHQTRCYTQHLYAKCYVILCCVFSRMCIQSPLLRGCLSLS